MLDLLFIDIETGKVNYAITDVTRVRYITPSEIGFDKGFNEDARSSSCAFPHTEWIEIAHKSDNPVRVALLREVSRDAI
jgi:hypothetical protein